MKMKMLGNVRVYIDSYIREMNATELRNAILCLPAWRREIALNFKFDIDRQLCTKSYLLLAKGLKEDFGISEQPKFAYQKQGKPYLKDASNIYFNMSHCKNGILCVIGNEPLGCDIECIPEHLDMGVAEYCFNQQELNSMLASPKPCVEFTKIWTRKEAALKFFGCGLIDDMKNLFSSDLLNKTVLYTEVNELRGYVYTVCKGRVKSNTPT